MEMEKEREREVRRKRRGRENAGISFERYIKRIRKKANRDLVFDEEESKFSSSRRVSFLGFSNALEGKNFKEEMRLKILSFPFLFFFFNNNVKML